MQKAFEDFRWNFSTQISSLTTHGQLFKDKGTFKVIWLYKFGGEDNCINSKSKASVRSSLIAMNRQVEHSPSSFSNFTSAQRLWLESFKLLAAVELRSKIQNSCKVVTFSVTVEESSRPTNTHTHTHTGLNIQRSSYASETYFADARSRANYGLGKHTSCIFMPVNFVRAAVAESPL